MFFFQKLPFCLCCCLQHLRFCSRTKRTLQGAFWKAFSGTTTLLSTIRSKGPLFLLLLCLRVQWCFRPIFDREFTTRSFKRKNSSSPELEDLLDFATICTVYDFLMMQVRNLLAALHYRWNFQMLSENCKNIYWLLNQNIESKSNTKINHTNETSFYLQKCILANRV